MFSDNHGCSLVQVHSLYSERVVVNYYEISGHLVQTSP